MVMIVLAGLPSKQMDGFTPLLSRGDRAMPAVCMVVYQGTMCLPPTHEHKSVREGCATGCAHFGLSARVRGDGHQLWTQQPACVPRAALYVKVPGCTWAPCCGGEDVSRGAPLPAHPCK